MTQKSRTWKISVLAGLFKTVICSDRNTKWIKITILQVCLFGSGTSKTSNCRKRLRSRDKHDGRTLSTKRAAVSMTTAECFLSARLPSQDRSTVSEQSGSEWSPQHRQYIHPKETRSQAKLTVLLSKTSSSTGSRRISCRTRAETVTTPSARSHLSFQPVREDRTFTSL